MHPKSIACGRAERRASECPRDRTAKSTVFPKVISMALDRAAESVTVQGRASLIDLLSHPIALPIGDSHASPLGIIRNPHPHMILRKWSLISRGPPKKSSATQSSGIRGAETWHGGAPPACVHRPSCNLRAEPQTPFTVYDNTQLPAAMITASHN
jgi:hypothetical protein